MVSCFHCCGLGKNITVEGMVELPVSWQLSLPSARSSFLFLHFLIMPLNHDLMDGLIHSIKLES